MYSSLKKNIILASANTFLFFTAATRTFAQSDPADVMINEVDLGFKIPNFSELLSFMVRFFFVMAGLAALFYMLWGAFSWVISGGDSEAVDKARGKITSAIIGMLVIVATLAIMWSLENIIFKKAICFGISCPVTLPNLLECVDDGSGRCN
jgi:magnesium-transporting ATPase (P-type)